MKRFLFCCHLSFIVLVGKAQSSIITPTTGWVDPALNHSRLLREQMGEGVYKLIGPYKVIGTPYLFGERNKGSMYGADATAINLDLGYNTYTQEIDFISPGASRPLVKAPGDLDSFTFQANKSVGLQQDIRFVYGKHLGSNEKAYFQQLAVGSKFGIYKRYKADVGYVSSNYVQSELRQFDLLFDYFLYNPTTKSIKKLKNNFNAIQKELSAFGNASGVFTSDAFTVNPDQALIQAVTILHQ
jgi:hypothetical protein